MSYSKYIKDALEYVLNFRSPNFECIKDSINITTDENSPSYDSRITIKMNIFGIRTSATIYSEYHYDDMYDDKFSNHERNELRNYIEYLLNDMHSLFMDLSYNEFRKLKHHGHIQQFQKYYDNLPVREYVEIFNFYFRILNDNNY